MKVSRTALAEAAARFAFSPTARLDAELLMAHAIGIDRNRLLLDMDRPVPPGFAALVERRAGHEPVAYITGAQEFFGLPFHVGPDVLIPRADSELLVERAIAIGRDARRILDCGTGSGALLLATLAHLPQATGLGIDRSTRALCLARRNAAELGLAGRAEMIRADWTEADWRAPLGMFHLILANPPYVESAADLAPSVRAFEPAGALFAGEEGLDDYRRLIPELPALLMPRGVALVEIGATQAAPVLRIGQGCGLVASVHRDLGGRDRVVEFTAGA